MSETLNKKALLEWLNREIKDDNWAQFSAERALRDVRNFVESGAFDLKKGMCAKEIERLKGQIIDLCREKEIITRQLTEKEAEIEKWKFRCSLNYKNGKAQFNERTKVEEKLNQALEALEWIVECSTDYQSISKARNALHFIKGGD